MIRVLNLVCVALMGLCILGLYHVSERTRVAHMKLRAVTRQIDQARSDISVLQTEWQHVASPDRVQRLAEARLGMSDTASVQLSSFALLPRRGDAPPDNSPVRDASAVVPAQAPHLLRAAVPGM
jgi:cell division protein FtsL